MNRWEVRFQPWIVPATVTAPTAADAIVVAAAMIRNAAGPGIIADQALSQPCSVKWLGPVPARADQTSSHDLSEQIAQARAEIARAIPTEEEQPRGAMWKCKLCQQLASAFDLETKHRHEDDPRSVYFKGPCQTCGHTPPEGQTVDSVGAWHEPSCKLYAPEAGAKQEGA